MKAAMNLIGVAVGEPYPPDAALSREGAGGLSEGYGAGSARGHAGRGLIDYATA
jgi:hypothetical protein